MNQSDVEKYINTRYTKNKYRNSWKEYRLSSKQNVGNVTSLLHENIEKEMLTIQKKY